MVQQREDFNFAQSEAHIGQISISSGDGEIAGCLMSIV